MKHVIIGAGLAAAIALGGCSRSSNVSTQSAITPGQVAAAGKVVVPAGTRFAGKLQQEIATNKSHDGDTFSLLQTDTLFHHDPALHGATVDGHLENVSPAAVGKKPSLTLVFDDIRLQDGTMAPVDVRLLNIGAFDAKTHHWRTAGMVLGGAIAGHVAAGKHHGGLLGGAGAYVLSQQMKTNVDVKPGTLIELRFLKDATAAPATATTP